MDMIPSLKKDVESLRADLFRLREEVHELRRLLTDREHPVEAMLRQRGLPVHAHGDRSHVLLPQDMNNERGTRLYRLMQRYSFRLFLRDLIQFQEGDDHARLARYCSLKTVRSYLKSLADMGIVETREDRSYRLLLRHISSFGPTLEWYVCEIFQREFMSPALFGVRLQKTLHGGDYDVIALLGGHLVYLEVKSSPPRGVELPAVSAFLNRLTDLQPHIAAFLVDTELRMRDKIVPLFEEAFEQRESREEEHVERLVDEIFHIRHRIYLINSRKGIYSNLRRCFRDFFLWEKKGGTMPARKPGPGRSKF